MNAWVTRISQYSLFYFRRFWFWAMFFMFLNPETESDFRNRWIAWHMCSWRSHSRQIKSNVGLEKKKLVLPRPHYLRTSLMQPAHVHVVCRNQACWTASALTTMSLSLKKFQTVYIALLKTGLRVPFILYFRLWWMMFIAEEMRKVSWIADIADGTSQTVITMKMPASYVMRQSFKATRYVAKFTEDQGSSDTVAGSLLLGVWSSLNFSGLVHSLNYAGSIRVLGPSYTSGNSSRLLTIKFDCFFEGKRDLIWEKNRK